MVRTLKKVISETVHPLFFNPVLLNEIIGDMIFLINADTISTFYDGGIEYF